MHQLKDYWKTPTGKIIILGGGGLAGMLSLCFVFTICSAIGSLGDSRQVANLESTPITQNTAAPPSTATPLPTEPLQPTELPEPTATPMPTATPKPTFTSLPTPTPDRCSVEVEQVGSSEPGYVGVQGYVVERDPPGDEYASLPSYPWGVPLLEQVGPNLWEEGDETLPHKTPVEVLEQHLKHQWRYQYSGFLVVKSLEDSKEYRIDHHNFTPTDYWNCPPHLAVKYSSFVARVKEDVKPVNKDGKWEDMGEQQEVFCTGIPGIGSDQWVENGVECFMYKQYRLGFGGVIHIFPSASLEIVY